VPDKQPELFTTETGFKVIGNNRYVAWYTNSYKDRDGETFTLQSIEKDTSRMFETKEMPELWFWHIKGTAHGKTDWIGTIGKFAVAVGTFDETPMAKEFKKLYKSGNYGLSHGFIYNPEKLVKGVYQEYKTFEISTLPPERAANPYTKFALSKGVKRAMERETIEALAATLGDKEALRITLEALDATKALDDAGVSYKQKETETEVVKEVNPLETRMATLEKGLADILVALKAEEDSEDDDEEEDDEEEDEKERNIPLGQKAVLSDGMRSMLLKEMEDNFEAELKEQQFDKLGLVDQTIARSFPNMGGV